MQGLTAARDRVEKALKKHIKKAGGNVAELGVGAHCCAPWSSLQLLHSLALFPSPASSCARVTLAAVRVGSYPRIPLERIPRLVAVLFLAFSGHGDGMVCGEGGGVTVQHDLRNVKKKCEEKRALLENVVKVHNEQFEGLNMRKQLLERIKNAIEQK